MLTRIVHNNPCLCTFIRHLGLRLSRPQLRHVTNVVDGLLMTDGRKTLAEVRRQYVSGVDPSNIADTFRIGPWTARDIRMPVVAKLIELGLRRLEEHGQPRRVLINLDDSLAIKDPDTRHLQGVDFHYYVRVLVSKTHPRNTHPTYFICTDLALQPPAALQCYARRWNCETDNLYLKQRLGLGDFRLQPYEAIDKFSSVVLLALAYLQWRLAQPSHPRLRTPADVIRLHGHENGCDWLRAVCDEVLHTGDVDAVIHRFSVAPT